MLQNKLCRYFILWDFFSQEFIFMEGVKKKKKKKKNCENLLQKGLFEQN